MHQPSQSQDYDVVIGPYDKTETGNPWTQQSLGCKESGDFVYIPNQFLNKTFQNSGSELFEQWTRFYYGLFTDQVLDQNVTSGSKQDSFCLGISPATILQSKITAKHPKALKYPSDPEFVVTREEPSKYVIVLENSRAMDFNNSWELIRTALRKFIKEDLEDPETQLGLVMFNEQAYIENTVAKIGDKHSKYRTDISLNIRHKFSLSHKIESCVRCGVTKAIEALHTTGSTIGANIILISQGHNHVLSREDNRAVVHLAKKHQLRIYSLPFVHNTSNISILFESMSYKTGGNSFFIQPTKSNLDVYMDILDSLREIHRRSESNGPSLVSRCINLHMIK